MLFGETRAIGEGDEVRRTGRIAEVPVGPGLRGRVVNALGVPIAAGVLYPAFGLLLSPMLAALAMSLSSVSVIANALRLRNARVA